MVTFDQRRVRQSRVFELELHRLSALVDDMGRIRDRDPIGQVAKDSPILDRWALSQRAIPCLVRLSTGHPVLVGDARPIATSDLWLISEDRQWARTLSRWYRLGREANGG